MKNTICFCIVAFLLTPILCAQENAEIFRDRTRTPLTCAWSTSTLYKGPGKLTQRLSSIRFGEIVERVGQKAYVGSEKRTYIEVKTPSGEKGWVYEFHFVNNGVPGVVQSRSRIYMRPRNNSSVTSDYFATGELVVLGTVSGDWAELFSQNKEKGGWIQGLNRISVKEEQLASAELSQRTARPYTSPASSYGSSSGSSDTYPPLASNSRGGQNFYPNSSRDSRENMSRGEIVGNLSALSTPRSQRQNSRSYSESADNRDYNSEGSRTLESYRDASTGTLQSQITEEGGIYLVNIPHDNKNLFVGYHRSLPVGSKVRVSFPDNVGFVEIEIIGSLRGQRPEVLGLYPECLALIFGNQIPNQIKFTYPNKK